MTMPSPAQPATSLVGSERQLQLLIDGVTDYAIYLLDPHGCVASWNSGAARIKGYGRDEILGKHVACFYCLEDQANDEPRRNLARAAEVGRIETEGWRLRKDGSRFWAHVTIARIGGDEGPLLGFAKVTRDVTAQRAAQRDLDVAREVLWQAQKVEALGKVTGGVAHDFNNMLMAIQAALDLIKVRHSDDARTDALVRLASASVDRGASLTRKMLGFSRRQALRPVAVDPVTVIHGMLALLTATAGPGANVTVQAAPPTPRIYVDPQELELAVINLIANARDALPNGGNIAVTVAAHPVSADDAHGHAEGLYVRVSVSDDGEGMDAEVLARASDPFFTTKEVGKGAGLGLSTVDGLAEQSGGWFAVHSAPNQGTRAEMWFPAMGAPAEGAAPRAPSSPNAARPTSALHVLLVDDDLFVLETVSALLEDLGHTVVQAQRGQQAIELLSSGLPCDVVITDYAMPGMTGDMVAEAVQALRPSLSVILATGYADLDAKRLARLARLTKPFDRRDLANALLAATAGHAS